MVCIHGTPAATSRASRGHENRSNGPHGVNEGLSLHSGTAGTPDQSSKRPNAVLQLAALALVLSKCVHSSSKQFRRGLRDLNSAMSRRLLVCQVGFTTVMATLSVLPGGCRPATAGYLQSIV